MKFQIILHRLIILKCSNLLKQVIVILAESKHVLNGTRIQNVCLFFSNLPIDLPVRHPIQYNSLKFCEYPLQNC